MAEQRFGALVDQVCTEPEVCIVAGGVDEAAGLNKELLPSSVGVAKPKVETKGMELEPNGYVVTKSAGEQDTGGVAITALSMAKGGMGVETPDIHAGSKEGSFGNGMDKVGFCGPVVDGKTQSLGVDKREPPRCGKKFDRLLLAGDVDSRIRSIECKLVVLSLSSADEKALKVELQELKRLRLKAS